MDEESLKAQKTILNEKLAAFDVRPREISDNSKFKDIFKGFKSKSPCNSFKESCQLMFAIKYYINHEAEQLALKKVSLSQSHERQQDQCVRLMAFFQNEFNDMLNDAGLLWTPPEVNRFHIEICESAVCLENVAKKSMEGLMTSDKEKNEQINEDVSIADLTNDNELRPYKYSDELFIYKSGEAYQCADTFDNEGELNSRFRSCSALSGASMDSNASFYSVSSAFSTGSFDSCVSYTDFTSGKKGNSIMEDNRLYPYGCIPGVEDGRTWKNRKQLSRSCVHKPMHAIICGGNFGIISLILCHLDRIIDEGKSFKFIGDKEEKPEVVLEEKFQENMLKDHQYHREFLTKRTNKALYNSWQTLTPVRVIRNCKLGNDYSPKRGYQYAGLYQCTHFELLVVEDFIASVFTFKEFVCDAEKKKNETDRSPEHSIAPERAAAKNAVHVKEVTRNLSAVKQSPRSKEKEGDKLQSIQESEDNLRKASSSQSKSSAFQLKASALGLHVSPAEAVPESSNTRPVVKSCEPSNGKRRRISNNHEDSSRRTRNRRNLRSERKNRHN